MKNFDQIFIPSMGSVKLVQNAEIFNIKEYEKLKREHRMHHYSVGRTLQMLKEKDREVNKKLVKRVIQECSSCCRIAKKIAPYNKVSIKPLPYRPLDELDVDFVFPEVESSEGHTCLLSARCEFTRYLVAIPCKNQGISNVICQLSNIFTILGHAPNLLCMDNEFNVPKMRAWAKNQSIRVHFRCAGSSRSIGVERSHKDIRSQWAKVMYNKNPRQWHHSVNQIIDPLNKAPNSITKVSPYKAMFGIPPQKISHIEVSGNSKECKERKQLYKMIYERTKKARLGYGDYHKWPRLEKGEEVIVKYSGARNAKEKIGEVMELSDESNPRVNVFFPDSIKCPELGIHKGMIYKRSKAVEPLFEGLVQSEVQFPHFSDLKYTPLVELRKSARVRHSPDRLAY